MPEPISNNKRIAKNTIALYFRMMVMMAIGLFTSRVILKTLGVVDFGINNVVGGIVIMFSFLNNTMTAATQRFLSFEMGKNNVSSINKVFNVAFVIHLFICVIVFVLAESVGLWFLKNKLVIPAERFDAALWVYQLSVISTLLGITQVPYQAVITAREKMGVYAYLSIIDVTLKLILVAIICFVDFDKLKLLALVVFFNGLIVFLITRIYCIRHFDECRLHFVKDWRAYLEILNYAGWNLSSHVILIARTQGVNILLNLFFGPAINAARGVAVQVNDMILRFSLNFQTAVVPQITKLYASGQLKEMSGLICMSSKISYLLLVFFMFPMILETECVLTLWLGKVPEWAVVFCKLTLIASLFDALSGTLVYGALAVGVVRKYHLTVGGILALNFVLPYFLLKNGSSPICVYYIECLVFVACLFVRLLFLKSYFNFSITLYLRDVVLRCFAVTGFMSLICIPVFVSMRASLIRFVIILLLSTLAFVMASLFVGLNMLERKKVFATVERKFPFLKRFLSYYE
jgi:O-antigen/teichoic acid export membrane protein